MMGKVVEDFSQPITKTTKGLIVLPVDHPMIKTRNMSLTHIIRQSKVSCIQCMRCTDLCPRHMLGHNLSPHRIMRGLNYLEGDQEVMKMALSCTECGACEYACNMMLLSPRRVNALLKQEFEKKGIKASTSVKQMVVAPSREFMKIPVNRLISFLGLAPYNAAAPLVELDYVPQRVSIPLKQHIGTPALPVVEIGRQVERGALIGTVPEGAMGANVHASISGIVQEISQCIVIEADGDGG
jgi:Na+-translocating ferredoxin:NAD+ oxidoreductase RnfC subunit